MSSAELRVDGKVVQLPCVEGTAGDIGIDVSQLRKKTGRVAVDSGAVNVTVTPESRITYLNGEKGVLWYRGIPIEQLAADADFLDVAYLLQNGTLASQRELRVFTGQVMNAENTPPLQAIFKSLPKTAHPMDVLGERVYGLAASRPRIERGCDREQELLTVERGFLMRAVPTIVANLYRLNHSDGNTRMAQLDPSVSYAEALLKVMFPKRELPPIFAKALNTSLVVHADHEQNCSTSTTRGIGSAEAGLIPSVVGGIAALSGPLHGGANEAVNLMLDEILESGMTLGEYLEKVKSKEKKLMGFGHRVYKSFDPRATTLKALCPEVLKAAGAGSHLYDVLKELENAALNDEYFIERKLYPNVDFYSGVIYRAIGIPLQFYTPLFVIGRLPGWMAHWHEQCFGPAPKIFRPRQIYTGSPKTGFTPVFNRA